MSRWLPLLIIVAATVLAYLNSFQGVFVFDDIPTIVQNQNLQDLGKIQNWFSAPKDTTAAGRPLTAFSFAVNAAISKFHPWSYHTFNLLLHLVNATILYAILRSIPNSPSARSPETTRFGFAFWTALIWALHPLQTNAVTYIVQRAEAIKALFYLLTIFLFLKAQTDSRTNRNRWLTLSVLAAYLGTLGKESMATAPLAILLIDRAFFSTTFRHALRSKPKFYGTLFSSWLLLLALTLGFHRTESVGFHFDDFVWWRYLLEQGPIILSYLKLIAYPSPLIFAAYVRDDTSLLSLIPAALLVGLLVLGSLYLFHRQPRLGLGPLLFFLILAPTSSVLPIVTEPYAEHRLYLAAIPILAILLWLLFHHLTKHDSPRIQRNTQIILTALACFLAALTVQRNTLFADPGLLWSDVVQKQPFNSKAWNNLGENFFSSGNPEKAAESFQAALNAQPKNYIAAFNLGVLRAGQGRHEDALAAYQTALAVKPDFPGAFASAAHSLIQLNRVREAEFVLLQALTLDPAHPIALLNLAVLQAQQGQTEAAQKTVDRLLQNHPNDRRALQLKRALRP
jgi:tetratricopeptide (TPR) repeat protein